MKKFGFKTNINCGGCIEKVTPFLNNNAGIKEWKVDTSTPDKILTIETGNLELDELKKIIENAGFKAEALS